MTAFNKDITLADVAEIQKLGQVVVLMYQSFCDPCNATKPTIEAIAEQYGLNLAKINCDNSVDATHAGSIIPSLSVYRGGRAVTKPLRGARTRPVIEAFLKAAGVNLVPV